MIMDVIAQPGTSAVPDDALAAASKLASVVETIGAWDLSFLAPRLAGEHGWSAARCKRTVEAYKQFMAVAACHPDTKLSVPITVDPAWHAHILHTIDYFRFCDAIAGRYLHHTPVAHGTTDDETVDVRPLVKSYFGATSLIDADPGDCGHDPCTACDRANKIPISVTRMFDVWRATAR